MTNSWGKNDIAEPKEDYLASEKNTNVAAGAYILTQTESGWLGNPGQLCLGPWA